MRILRTRRLPVPRRDRGSVAVEFAITATLLSTIVFGASELGRAMYQYDTLVKSTRAATRYLAQFSAGDAASITQAKCLVVYGSTACGGATLVPNLTAAMVSVCDASSCVSTNSMQSTGRGFVNLVTVTITGVQFQSLVSGFVPNFTMNTISATMPQGF